MYDALLSALQAIGIPFQEYGWDQRPDVDYGLVSIDGAGEVVAADNHIQEQAIEGTIDLFTHGNDRASMAAIQGILDGLEGCAWYLNSVQYEQETRLIHWEWVFQLEAM